MVHNDNGISFFAEAPSLHKVGAAPFFEADTFVFFTRAL
jgi:hypothetical protein